MSMEREFDVEQARRGSIDLSTRTSRDPASTPQRQTEPHLMNRLSREEYAGGYPEITHQIARFSNLQLFRRFKRTRMRLILAKQDCVTELEEKLDSIDDEEGRNNDVGHLRGDGNKNRTDVLRDLDFALAEYDSLVQRSQWALNVPDVESGDAKSLRKILRRGTITQEGTMYVDQGRRELMYVGVVRGRGMDKLSPVAEFIVRSFDKIRVKLMGPHGEPGSTSKLAIRGVSRALAAALTIAILLVPVIVLNFVHTTVWKFVVIFVAAAIFVSGIAVASTAALGEIFVGGATYAAVLVVFVSQNEISDST